MRTAARRHSICLVAAPPHAFCLAANSATTGCIVGFPLVEQQEYDRLVSRCNKMTEAHDPSSGQYLAPPSAAELGADLVALKAIIKITKARQNANKP
jgi:hypothetical protein